MTADKYAIDSHKLKYHPDRVAQFLKTGDTAPVYVEISPTAFCNHRCVFCHYNYIGHEGSFAKGRMLSLIDELADAGTKSVVFAGIGEPLLNPETVPAVVKAKKLGIDAGMSTNGALMKDGHIPELVQNLTWIRFSFNAATPEKYAEIHHTKPEDFEKALVNIEKLAKEKKRAGASVTIGLQFILLSDNLNGIDSLVGRVKKAGADYFSMKHFYEHEKNSMKCSSINEEQENMLKAVSAKYSDPKFSVILRSRENLNRTRVYDKCMGLPFIVYIRENGDVYTCFSYQHDEKTVLGNINKSTFADIWKSGAKKDAVDYINNCIEKNNCQPNCRHHQINNYLWELTHPSVEHINFI
ncbi:MAG: radical SAM protein [Deferribacterales bacterium]